MVRFSLLASTHQQPFMFFFHFLCASFLYGAFNFMRSPLYSISPRLLFISFHSFIHSFMSFSSWFSYYHYSFCTLLLSLSLLFAALFSISAGVFFSTYLNIHIFSGQFYFSCFKLFFREKIYSYRTGKEKAIEKNEGGQTGMATAMPTLIPNIQTQCVIHVLPQEKEMTI